MSCPAVLRDPRSSAALLHALPRTCALLVLAVAFIFFPLIDIVEYCKRSSYTLQTPGRCRLQQGHIYTILKMATATSIVVVSTSIASAAPSSTQNSDSILSGGNPSSYTPSNPVRIQHQNQSCKNMLISGISIDYTISHPSVPYPHCLPSPPFPSGISPSASSRRRSTWWYFTRPIGDRSNTWLHRCHIPCSIYSRP
jgi:hypothetical protein